MSSALTIGGIAALAVGVAGVGMSAYELSQQSGTTSQARGEAGAVFGEQQGFEQQLNALMANPGSVTSLPGYKFNFDQGADATARTMAAGGFLNSGNEAAAETEFGQNYAMNTFNQQASLLSSLSGLTAASSPSQLTSAATASEGQTANTASGALNSLEFMSLLNKNPASSNPASQVPMEVLPAGGGLDSFPWE